MKRGREVFCALLLVAGNAWGQGAAQFPDKPLRLVVTFAPGGNSDILARAVGPKLTEAWGKSVVVDNRSGGGGVIATEIVAKSAPDGYTILVGSTGELSINPGLIQKLPYDVERDFAPVTLGTVSPLLFIAHPTFAGKSIRELVELAKAKPVAFDASASQPGSSPIVSYNWTFGNGTVSPVSPDPSVSTIYDRAGDYEVTVFVVDANGLDSYASTRITVDARLETSVWTLPSLNGQPLLPGTAITLQFLQGRLTGFASCNTYEGNYTATDNGDGTYSIVGQQISTSRLACPAEIMAQENAYLAALRQATTASVQENQLTLTSPAGTLVFSLINPR